MHGELDGDAGESLLAETRTALVDSPMRIDIDLRAVASHTDEGASALVACRSLCADLPEGLHFRTDAGPGGDALLAAFTAATEDEAI